MPTFLICTEGVVRSTLLRYGEGCDHEPCDDSQGTVTITMTITKTIKNQITMVRENIVKGIINMLEDDIIGRENLKSPITEDTLMRDELAMDSLDMMDMATRLERKYDVDLSKSELEVTMSVGDIATIVKKALDCQGGNQ